MSVVIPITQNSNTFAISPCSPSASPQTDIRAYLSLCLSGWYKAAEFFSEIMLKDDLGRRLISFFSLEKKSHVRLKMTENSYVTVPETQLQQGSHRLRPRSLQICHCLYTLLS